MENKRLKLGIIFNFSSSWMGGIIYIINLIKTMNFLDDEEKPEIFLFYRKDLARFLDEMKYPFLHAVEWNFPSIIKGDIKSWLLRKNLFIDQILKNYFLDVIYPLQDYPVRIKTPVKLVSWCADFQHKHYPEFFSSMQITGRNLRTSLALRNTDDLVLSSHDAHKDLVKFFSIRKGLNIHIFHFVSVIDNLDQMKIDDLQEKYNLPDGYFLISNQFHKHKNHKVVLLAVAKLKQNGIIRHLAITGKFPDAKNSPYLGELHSIIDENNLQSQISFLGVIPRLDQLLIMKYAQAVIQPSLFEGWSTVIEDAKSLQVPVIASNLNVNMEQLGKDGVYFDPLNADELASLLADYPQRNLNDLFYEEYPKRIKEAARNLLYILSGN
jgi:glycosyltransferase involved in cell wall biosynthesis